MRRPRATTRIAHRWLRRVGESLTPTQHLGEGFTPVLHRQLLPLKPGHLPALPVRRALLPTTDILQEEQDKPGIHFPTALPAARSPFTPRISLPPAFSLLYEPTQRPGQGQRLPSQQWGCSLGAGPGLLPSPISRSFYMYWAEGCSHQAGHPHIISQPGCSPPSHKIPTWKRGNGLAKSQMLSH